MDRELERRLVEQCQCGDGAAFEPLVRAHERPLYGTLLALCGDPDEAKDLLQETFLRAWRRIDRFDTERPLRPWLLALARRCYLDAGRARYGRRGVRRRFSEVPTFLPAPEVAPDEALERAERRSRLWQALGRLPSGQRELITLKDIAGLPYEEIARMQGIPQGTVASRVYYARRALSRVFEPAAAVLSGGIIRRMETRRRILHLPRS